MQSFSIVYAPKHAVTLKLQLGEKLVLRGVAREGFAGLDVFVDVARIVALTSQFDVNEHAVHGTGAVHNRIRDATNCAVVARTLQRVDFAAWLNAHRAKVN